MWLCGCELATGGGGGGAGMVMVERCVVRVLTPAPFVGRVVELF